MRCHYEVLGVEKDADDAQLKKAYQKEIDAMYMGLGEDITKQK